MGFLNVFNTKETKAIRFAKEGYARFASTENAAVRELYDYYKGIRAWANITENDSIDQRIMAGFKKLANGYDEKTEKGVWKEVNKIWISNTDTISETDKLNFTLKTDEIREDTAKEVVELLSREMLATHIVTSNPPVAADDDARRIYYQHLVENLVKPSKENKDYSGNDAGWWLVYDVQQQSWLKNVKGFVPGGFDDLKDKIEPRREPKPERTPEPLAPEPKAEEKLPPAEPIPAPAPEPPVVPPITVPPVKRYRPTPPPPLMPAFARKLNVLPPLRTEEKNAGESGDSNIKTVSAENLRSGDLTQQLDKWIKEKLTVREKGELNREKFEIFEDGSNGNVNAKADEVMRSTGANKNAICKSILKATEESAKKAAQEGRYDVLVSYAQNLVVGNRSCDVEISLMAMLLSEKGHLPEPEFNRYLEYVELRAEAIRKGYEVYFDLGGKIYIVKLQTGQSGLRAAA